MIHMKKTTRLERLCMDASFLWGRPPITSGYENRLKLQKIAYLLQKFGVDFGYRFVWHYAGPFSFDLHFEYYDPTKYAKAEDVKTDRAKLAEFKEKYGKKLENADELEMLASILYLNEDRNAEMDTGRIVELMKLNKPKFSESQVMEGIDFLKKIAE